MLALRVRVFTLPGRAPSAKAPRATLELSALGDFEPSNESVEVLPADRVGAALRFPAETRAVLARLGPTEAAQEGYGERRADEGIDVLLWPDEANVVLATSPFPGSGGGQALGFSAESNSLLVAGGNDPRSTEAIVGLLRLDTSTGALRQSGVSDGLTVPRAFATATPFGSGFLIAGGERPVDGVPEAQLEVHATAELVGDEPGSLVALQNARTHHAAIALADGRTLLVGGRTKVDGTSIAQYQLEIVDPAERRARVGDAIAERISPTLLRLSDGRLFVGGGTLLDGSLSAPVGEWLSAEGRSLPTRIATEVPPRFERAFVAMAGGGLLAVGGCEDRPPASDVDAETCRACSSGCPPLDGWDAWWLDRDGVATPVSLLGLAAPRPVLLPGSDGGPWLVASDAAQPTLPRLFRFNPWAASFEPAEVPGGLRLPRPGLPALALAPDSFTWVDEGDDGPTLLGLRLGARSRFSHDVALVRSYEPSDPSRPAHLVPARAPAGGAAYDGALTLTDPELEILVADADYGDVTVRLELEGAALPRVRLGTTTLGGDACPWPEGEARGGDADAPTVVRRGARAELRYHGGRSAPCDVGSERVSVGLVAGERAVTVRKMDVLRAAGATAF